MDPSSPAELSSQIAAARFSPVRLREGYDMGQVDAFLARLADAASAGEPLGPLVDAAVFAPVRLREGYDMGEVDRFLEQVAGRQPLPSPPPSVPTVPPAADPLPTAVQEQRGFFARLRGR